jgi:hypothetical protein
MAEPPPAAGVLLPACLPAAARAAADAGATRCSACSKRGEMEARVLWPRETTAAPSAAEAAWNEVTHSDYDYRKAEQRWEL